MVFYIRRVPKHNERRGNPNLKGCSMALCSREDYWVCAQHLLYTKFPIILILLYVDNVIQWNITSLMITKFTFRDSNLEPPPPYALCLFETVSSLPLKVGMMGAQGIN